VTLCQASGESSVAGFMTVTLQGDTLSARLCRLWFDSSHMCSIFVHYCGSFLPLIMCYTKETLVCSLFYGSCIQFSWSVLEFGYAILYALLT
jgi:hypothetical protein